MAKAFVNPTDIINANAAGRIAPHCLVTRSAAGTVVVNTASTDEQYIGVAGDRSVENDDDPGFFSQYDPIPIATQGRVRLLLLGGGTDVQAGQYLQAQADGLVAIESSGNRTTESVAKAVEDQEVSDYSTSITAQADAGQATVTVTSTTNFSAGDYVQLKDNNATELAMIKSITSSTVLVLSRALANTFTIAATPLFRKGVQTQAILL